MGFWVRDIARSRAFYETYLGFDEPYDLHSPNGALQMVVAKVNDGQSIYLFPNPSRILPNADNLDHLGLVTDNAAALHDQLVAGGVKASPVHMAKVGDLIFIIKDPDGRPYEVTQLEPNGQPMKHQGRSLPATRISDRLESATIMTVDMDASLRFYRGQLGFKETRQVRGADGVLCQVALRVPNGSTGVVLELYTLKAGAEAPRAVPEFCLAVTDVSQTFAILSRRAATGGFPAPSPITTEVDGRRQTSCVDPDGTRVVFREAGR